MQENINVLDKWRTKGEYTPVAFALRSGPDPSPRLVGIARLAADSRPVEAKRRVEYRELPSRSLLNRCSNDRMPFRWTVNPYRGCEFGCKYCYARYTHEFMGIEDGELFERRIFAKADAVALLRRDLAKLDRSGRGGEGIAIGTSTDPYQPAERRFEITRSLLEAFAEGQGRDLSLTTKSDLVARDVELLARIGERNRLSVNVTVTTTDIGLARRLEPYAPRPDLRLDAVRILRRGGIEVGVFASPVMPLITDSESSLDAVARAAATAGATYFGGGTLFLMPSAQQQFFPFLEKAFPDLVAGYRRRFEKEAYLRGPYADDLRLRIQRIREKHGLASGPKAPPPEPPAERQLSLFD